LFSGDFAGNPTASLNITLNGIGDTILDESSPPEELRSALDRFSQLCTEASGIRADPSFDAWSDDALLKNGIAINPQAAAHCVVDYARTVAFIRGISAAIDTLQQRFPESSLEVLYAGCGPFATLVLPLLGKLSAGQLKIYLLDIHQRSLDSVTLLLNEFGLSHHSVKTIRADACDYTHPRKLHLVISETMQKSLEQEPQFAVTANLAPQLRPRGLFIPQCIEVCLALADLSHEKTLFSQSGENECDSRDCRDSRDSRDSLVEAGTRYRLGTVCRVVPEFAFEQLQDAQDRSDGKTVALKPTTIEIPSLEDFAQLDAALFTRIDIFQTYRLEDYESQITLPLKCFELLPLESGERYSVSYQLGSYPKFNFERMSEQ